MSKARIFGFCVFFVLVSFVCTASSEDSINLKHFKSFKGGNDASEFLKVNLITAKRTRVQIMVTKRSEIVENHRLVVGPKGVCEGQYSGARWWGYVLPEGIRGTDLEVAVFVLTIAGQGEPLRYEIRNLSTEDKPGFFLSSVATR